MSQESNRPIFDWQSVLKLPDTRIDRERQRVLFEEELWARFEEFVWDIQQRGKPVDLSSPKIIHEFDKYIVLEAEHLGPVMLLSDRVVDRLICWNVEHNIVMLRRFSDAIIRGTKIRAGGVGHQAKANMKTPLWHRLKKLAVPELDTLQACVVSESRRSQAPWDVINQALSHTPESYPNLCCRSSSLKSFCLSHASECRLFCQGSLHAAEFFDHWGAWSTNKSPESFRKDVSESLKH